MHEFGARDFLTVEQSTKVHRATRVGGDDEIDVGLANGPEFSLPHGRGDFGEFDGEGSAKTAAKRVGRGGYDTQSLDRAHQRMHGVFDPQFPKGVTSDMQGGATLETSAQVRDAHLIHEEFAEFENPVAHGRIHELWVMVAHHGGARTGRANDGIEGAKHLAEMPGQFPSLFSMTCIEMRLAAASLLFGILGPQPEMLENVDRGDGHGGIEAVDETGDEKAESHEGSCRWCEGRCQTAGAWFASSARKYHILPTP